MRKKDRTWLVYNLEVTCVCGLIIGVGSLQTDNIKPTIISVGRYIIYLLTTKMLNETCNMLLFEPYTKFQDFIVGWKNYIVLYVAAFTVLIYFNACVMNREFLMFVLAYLIAKYPEIAGNTTISYGVGMACSFFEGYLAQIIPSDGHTFLGLEENIRLFENKQGVVFPVKKLFIIITKSLYCPPDLKHFNKTDKELPYLEACQPLSGVRKDVAGVKGRVYRSSAYKLRRGRRALAHVAAECATPLHTLRRVLVDRDTYQEIGNINVDEVVYDFTRTLQTLIDKSPECRGKCELVFYDDTNPDLNLAEILLDRIRHLEPDFESIIDNSCQ